MRPLVGICTDRVIPDEAITASTYLSVNGKRDLYGKGEMWRSRLDNNESTSWMGNNDDDGYGKSIGGFFDSYIQWDLGGLKTIEAVQTKGCAVVVPNIRSFYKQDKGPEQHAWVSGYRLSYSIFDDSDWTTHP